MLHIEEIWNGFYDVETEDHLNDYILAMRFCGLDLEDEVLDLDNDKLLKG